jgi:hypothetical protein
MAHLTTNQRLVLADCVRTALHGWLLSDPIYSEAARRWQHKATTMLGFSFSRFMNSAVAVVGPDYRPHSPASPARFPLSISEAAALANNIELHLAADDELMAAAVIAAHSPFGHPSVGGRDWRTYIAALGTLGLSIHDNCPEWRDLARDHLASFRQHHVNTLVAAE